MNEEYSETSYIRKINSCKLFIVKDGEVVGTGGVSKIEFEDNPIVDSCSDEEYIKKKMNEYSINEKYPTPFYQECLHPKKVILRRKYRIRNRPNSGHGFKKNNRL